MRRERRARPDSVENGCALSRRGVLALFARYLAGAQGSLSALEPPAGAARAVCVAGLAVAGVVGAVDRAGRKWAAAMVINKEAANRGRLL
jgi:hypothetical protein